MEFSKPAPAQRAPLLADVVQRLTGLIQDDGLAPGDRLPSIRQLSARLGARPHVVRDALLQVQAAGLIDVRPRSRAVVRAQPLESPRTDLGDAVNRILEQDDHHVFHLLAARELIELETVRQVALGRRLEDLLPVRDELNAMNEAASREEYVEHDLRFHLAIARVAGNPILTAMLRPLLAGLRPFLCHEPIYAFYADRVRTSHAEIYRALVAGEPEAAREEMHAHLQMGYEYLLKEVQRLPELPATSER